jgi:hypothetical protein
MEKIAQWLKEALTEDDNSTICVAKVMAVLAFLSFLGYSIYGLWKDHFALVDFANGIMQVLLGSAGVIAGKQITQK